MSAREKPVHRNPRRTVWSMTPTAWVGTVGLILYWIAINTNIFGITPESREPVRVFASDLFSFVFPWMFGLGIIVVTIYRAWKDDRLEATAGIVGVLLVLSLPLALVLTVFSLLSS